VRKGRFAGSHTCQRMAICRLKTTPPRVLTS
jgi:hypothetical protein